MSWLRSRSPRMPRMRTSAARGVGELSHSPLCLGPDRLGTCRCGCQGRRALRQGGFLPRPIQASTGSPFRAACNMSTLRTIRPSRPTSPLRHASAICRPFLIKPKPGRISILASTSASTLTARSQPIAPDADTSKQTVWSFGVTAFAQRRLREPLRSSDALFLIPSAAWVISEDWNASFGVEMLGRWFDANQTGSTRRDWDITPIATLEYILPAWLFSEQRLARFVGRPAIDLQISRQVVSSTSPSASYAEWEASATLKAGWRF